MICLVTANKKVEEEFKELAKKLKIPFVKAENIQETKLHLSTHLCKGVLIDSNWMDNSEISQQLSEIETIIILKDETSKENLQKDLEAYLAKQPDAYALPEALIQDYNKTIPDKLQRLRKNFDSIKSSYNEENLMNLRKEIHKIAGNAGTYGYLPVSVYCKECEKELIDQIQQKNSSQSSDKIAILERFLDRIEQEFKPQS